MGCKATTLTFKTQATLNYFVFKSRGAFKYMSGYMIILNNT